jgi:predicted RNA-binding protein with PUA-like domain
MRMQVVKSSYADPSQFDSKGKYYDRTATKESPRWFCVDVKLVKKLENPITLAELKEHSEGKLKDMALFKMKRLSVQPVAPNEWDFILSLGNANSSG